MFTGPLTWRRRGCLTLCCALLGLRLDSQGGLYGEQEEGTRGFELRGTKGVTYRLGRVVRVYERRAMFSAALTLCFFWGD
jgi:hypothetical protein